MIVRGSHHMDGIRHLPTCAYMHQNLDLDPRQTYRKREGIFSFPPIRGGHWSGLQQPIIREYAGVGETSRKRKWQLESLSTQCFFVPYRHLNMRVFVDDTYIQQVLGVLRWHAVACSTKVPVWEIQIGNDLQLRTQPVAISRMRGSALSRVDTETSDYRVCVHSAVLAPTNRRWSLALEQSWQTVAYTHALCHHICALVSS